VAFVCACASTQFSKDIEAHRWMDAARAFDRDSSLRNNEQALYQAAMLYSFPNRDTYDPTEARALFERLLQLYPTTQHRQSALDHIAMLDAMQLVRDSAVIRQQTTQNKIAQIIGQMYTLRARLDTVTSELRDERSQNALLRKIAARLENDLQDRESQLRALNAELSRLKEIDLKPSLRNGVSGDTAIKPKKR
jgi:hypothetical protein